jgi:hypothetical protein
VNLIPVAINLTAKIDEGRGGDRFYYHPPPILQELAISGDMLTEVFIRDSSRILTEEQLKPNIPALDHWLNQNSGKCH